MLLNEGAEVKGEEELVKHITDYYKTLFGEPGMSDIRLGDIKCAQLAEEDRKFLTKEFSLEEMKEVVFGLKHNKAAGLDGLPAEFYQKFWDVVKLDLKEMFDAFHRGELNIERLNHGIIALIPKVQGANVIQKFRPICLLNVSYKILTKLLAVRLGLIIDRFIAHTQTAFIKDRFIMEGVVLLHETVHEMKVRKMSGVLLKIDFEKAYDQVKWPFLY